MLIIDKRKIIEHYAKTWMALDVVGSVRRRRHCRHHHHRR